jgi:hypothetical protein
MLLVLILAMAHVLVDSCFPVDSLRYMCNSHFQTVLGLFVCTPAKALVELLKSFV